MPLIRCPECNAEISDKVDVCVHCGYPIKKDKENNVIENNTRKDETGSDSLLCVEVDKGNTKKALLRMNKKKFGLIGIILLLSLATLAWIFQHTKTLKKEDIMNHITVRGSRDDWTEPVLESYHRYDNLVISIPTNWRHRDRINSTTHDLEFFYYPYDNNVDGFIWIYDHDITIPNFSSEREEYANYVGKIKNEDNYDYIEDYEIDIQGIPACFLHTRYKDIDIGVTYEMYEYLLCIEKKFHLYCFGEVDELSDEMKVLADNMINTILLIDDVDQSDSTSSTVSEKQNQSQSDSNIKTQNNDELTEFAANYIACIAKNTFKNPFSVTIKHVYVMAVPVEDSVLYSITVSLTAENGEGSFVYKTYSGNIVLNNSDVENDGFYNAIEDVMNPDSEFFLAEMYWSEDKKYCDEDSKYAINAYGVQYLYNGII